MLYSVTMYLFMEQGIHAAKTAPGQTSDCHLEWSVLAAHIRAVHLELINFS